MDQVLGESRSATAMDTISERNKLFPPLLRLPAEIRTRVYEYALLVDHIDGLWCATSSGQSAFAFCTTAHDRVEPLAKLLSPLQTCRQICQEAALVPFTVNAFRVNIAHLGDLVLALPLRARRALAFLELAEGRNSSSKRDRRREDDERARLRKEVDELWRKQLPSLRKVKIVAAKDKNSEQRQPMEVTFPTLRDARVFRMRTFGF